jgi:hypothetical protein
VSDVFQEVDEDVRRDSLMRLWKRYQYYAVALAVVIIAVTGAVSYWRYRDLQQREAEGVRYAAALDQARAGKYAEAADALILLSNDAHSGRAVLARFEAAALRARASDEAAAVSLYDAIAKDSTVDPLYRDLATVLWGLQALDTTDAQPIIDRVAPIAQASNPWHCSAIEVTAIAHLKAGDRAAARADYQRLSDDLTAPQGMRARAAEMVSALAA